MAIVGMAVFKYSVLNINTLPPQVRLMIKLYIRLKRKVSFLALLNRNLPLKTRYRLNQVQMYLTVLYAIHQPLLDI